MVLMVAIVMFVVVAHLVMQLAVSEENDKQSEKGKEEARSVRTDWRLLSSKSDRCVVVTRRVDIGTHWCEKQNHLGLVICKLRFPLSKMGTFGNEQVPNNSTTTLPKPRVPYHSKFTNLWRQAPAFLE